MRVTVISPERTVFDAEADGLVAPALDGLVGILPGHAPFLTVLGEGSLRVRQGAELLQFGIGGGFLQVTREIVRVVADRLT